LKTLIGLSALEHLPWFYDSFLSHGARNLREQVVQGRCAVVVKCDGSVERIVRVAALRISRHSGELLMQLGYFKAGSFTFACGLPGTKLERGETHQEGVTRVLATKLNSLKNAVVLATSPEEDTSEAVSLNFQIKTRYFRTVSSALVAKPYAAPVIHASRSIKVSHRGSAGERDPRLGEVLQSEAHASLWDRGRLGIYIWTHEGDLELLKVTKCQRHVEEWAKTLKINWDVIQHEALWTVHQGGDSLSDTSSSAFSTIPDEYCV